jgi:hypothetical protein
MSKLQKYHSKYSLTNNEVTVVSRLEYMYNNRALCPH